MEQDDGLNCVPCIQIETEISREQIVFSYQISLENQQVSFAFLFHKKEIKFQDTWCFVSCEI